MELKQLSMVISGTSPISQLDTFELERLVEKYPYSQIFTILYLKAISKQQPFDFKEKLEKYAFRVTDRMRLYEIIHQQESSFVDTVGNDEVTLNVDTSFKEEDNQMDTPSSFETRGAVVDEAVPEEQEVSESQKEEEEATQQSSSVEIESIHSETQFEQPDEIDAVKTEVALTEEIEQNSEDETEAPLEGELDNSKNTQELDALEKSILSNAVGQAYLYELSKEADEISKANRLDALIDKQLEVERRTVKSESDKERQREEQKKKEKILPNSFLDWIDKGSTEDIIERKDMEKLDELTRENPIISDRKEFYSPSKMAKESLNKDTLMYSETLANIYELQGNFPLAIKAYEHLCLSNPKKITIFAKKIELLKEKLTNIK